jgi:hypothetical protein
LGRPTYRLNENFDLSENDFNNLVDELTKNLLGEFIDLSESDPDEIQDDLPF